jgi:ubiquinone/menaquinone biosynthesis C-methylase UbiE
MPEQAIKNSSQFLDPTKLFEFFKIEEGMKIADFGAGSGYITFMAAKLLGKSGVIYALDIKKSVISHLKNEVKQRDVTQLKPIWTNLEMANCNPIQTGTIDIVLIITMLFQSIRHKEILTEAYRVLKPDGIIVIVDWKKEKTPFGPPVEERVPLEKIKEIAYAIGLNRLNEFEPSPYHFGIIFKK